VHDRDGATKGMDSEGEGRGSEKYTASLKCLFFFIPTPTRTLKVCLKTSAEHHDNNLELMKSFSIYFRSLTRWSSVKKCH